jgi:serine/threonine protein kinase
LNFDTEQLAYRNFRSIVAERTNPVIAWVGSGLSAPAGIPIWGVLKAKLVKMLNDKAEGFLAEDRTKAKARAKLIESQVNPWIAFQMLKKELGRTTYKDGIRDAVKRAEAAAPPSTYCNLWKLRLRGLINLNIDRLATKAYVQETHITAPLEFAGQNSNSLGGLLKETRPFILNLHGHAEDASSWVFTQSELQSLRKLQGYQDFVRACLFSNTILFIGISADDLAVGGHLEQLASANIDTGTHYWVTSRTDRATDRWAESVGIRVIRYEAPNNDHSALDVMFHDLLQFVPPEDPPVQEPVISSTVCATGRDLPDPADLATRRAEEVRQTLNAYAQKLLAAGGDTAQEYARFQSTYDEAIYRAWYVSTAQGQNSLLGYELQDCVARGAFGKVYRASGPWGEPLAIKVLLEEIRNNAELLQSFRRGARSMRILGNHNVEGVVAYRDSSEIPAMVVMDWIEGPTLQQAVCAKMLRRWDLVLRMAKHLTRILRRAHELPERVLHRDLRPSNVMLKDFFTKGEDWRVVVLDFDLSWHRGATERSVTHGAAMFGFLAPEQIQKIPGISTRHAAVDSFGLGMVLFFVVSSRHPVPDEQRHGSWANTVRDASRSIPCKPWKSVPDRFARLILNATRERQSLRWDMAQIETELTRLEEAVLHPDRVSEADLIAEELAFRSKALTQYDWDEDTATAIVERPTGLRVTLHGDVVRHKLELSVDWTSTLYNRKLEKRLRPTVDAACAILRSGGWAVMTEDIGAQTFHIRAHASPQTAVHDFDGTAGELDRAMDQLRVD